MSHYETLFIVHPEKGTRIKELIDRFKKVVEAEHGSVSHVDEWGLRELAYRIEKQSKGFYVLFQYESPAHAVEELERNLRLTDDILRYLTVRVDEEAPSAEPTAGSGQVEEGAGKPESAA